MLSSDFDGTIAQTFVPSPNNIGVDEAYRLSCADIFGSEGSELYDRVGGIKNRTPIELVNDLLEAGNRVALIGAAEGFLFREREALQGFVPEGKGANLDWRVNSPSLVIAEVLVRVKMRHFWTEIGSRFPDGRIWPEPCAGFLEFYHEFVAFKDRHVVPGITVVLGVLSSGHDHFITRCFDAWEVSHPDFLVTDDLMRSPACDHIPFERRNKPATGPFEMFEGQWLQRFGEKLKKDETLYVGDSLKTDGDLALNLGILFAWFNPSQKVRPRFGGSMLCISDWRELEPLFRPSTIDKMQQGGRLSDIALEVCAS